MSNSLGSLSTDAAGNQYKVVLADDFSGGYNWSKWGATYNGGVYGNGAFWWNANDVKVANGEMQVSATHQANGSWSAGGFNSKAAGITIKYGTVEFDARVEAGQGTQAAILMWPKSNVWPRDGEIDILEAPKAEAMQSVHWAGEHNENVYSSKMSGVDSSQTHHYAMTWLPDLITVAIDGKVVASWTDPNMIPDTAMGFGAMGYVANNSETWLGGGPDSTTPNKVTTHIDNVVMSQWVGKTDVVVQQPQVVVQQPQIMVKPPEPGVDTTPIVKTVGTGSDALTLKISQDVYKVGAQYTVSVDGKQIGGTLTAGASHAAGQDDTITVKGDWAAGNHTVSVNFLNDGWGGSAATDRNLHVDGITYNGAAVAHGTADLKVNGPASFSFVEAAPIPSAAVKTIGAGNDSLVLKVSQDAYNGNAQYTVSVDGKQIGGVLTASASHAAGQDDTITVKGDWTAGTHKMAVNFLNDSYGGSASADRNLHVDGITYNGATVGKGTADLTANGPATFSFIEAAPVASTPGKTIGAGSDALVLKISQDAYKGNAEYTVSVDGKQIGGVLTASAAHGAGHDDLITVNGDWGVGTHKIGVTFLNDIYGGWSGADRNLHVDGITFNGTAVAKGTADLTSNGSANFSFVELHDTAHASSDMIFA